MAASVGAQEVTLHDYVRAVRRRIWIVLGITVVCAGAALVYSLVQTPLYKASAQLMYETQLNVADPLSTGRYLDTEELEVELNSVGSVIASPDLVKVVKTELGGDYKAIDYTVAATVDSPSDQTAGNTVSITAIGPSARTTARVANSYAKAFIGVRKAREQARVRQAIQVVKGEMDGFVTPASRESAEYLTLQQRLQDLQILESTATGNFRLLVPATVPREQDSPRPVRNVVIGLAAGLILGIVVALLLAQFDSRVRTREEVAAQLGMPLLGHIPRLPGKTLQEQPLVVMGESGHAAAEAIRRLRGNLQFANIDGDLDSLFITSCLQHEGKSLTVCNLGLSMAAAGNRVILVDGDLRRPQVHNYLNLRNSGGVSTVLTGRQELTEAIHAVPAGPDFRRPKDSSDSDARPAPANALYVLTSGPLPPNPGEIIASKSFAALMDSLRSRFDIVLVDTPALLAVGDAAAIARCVDGLVFLVDIARAKRPFLAEAAGLVSQMPCRKLGVIVIDKALSRRAERHQYGYYARST